MFGEDCTTAHQILSDQIKKTRMGRACRTYGRKERCVQGFWWGDLKERDYSRDLGIEGG
jgi:hypothetical protein